VELPARELQTLAERFQHALEFLLRDLGVSAPAIEAELETMETVAFAKTTDRSVRGSLNEFAYAVRWALEDNPDQPLHELSVKLADTPILPLKDFPDRMTHRLLEQRIIH
jgi:hypothetical protein